MIGNILAETPYELERLGCFTASEIHRLFKEPKTIKDKEAGKLSAESEKYVREKLAELLTGKQRHLDGIWALEYGNNTEPQAIKELQKKYPNLIYYGNEDRKFFPMTRLSGGTPDGVDETLKLVAEIKCPENQKVHIDYLLLKDEADLKDEKPEYFHQLQMNMVCVAKSLKVPFEKMKGIFVSYSPDFDPAYQLKLIEVTPENGYEDRLIEIIKRAEKHLSNLKDQL